MTSPVPASVVSALAALWRLPPVHPNDLFEVPAFIRLCTACQDSYANAGWDWAPKFALLHALRCCLKPV